MPQVRVYEGGAVQAGGLTTARLQPVQGAPSVLGMGLEAAGATVQKMGDVQEAVNETVDETNAKHLYSQYVEHSDAVLHSGDNPFYALNGKAALDARPDTEKSLTDQRDALIAAATSPYQRKLLTDALGPRVEEDLKGVGSHAVTETIRYSADESVNRVSLLQADAARNFLDPKISEGNIGDVRGEVSNLARINHWGPETLAAKTLTAVSAVRHDIATRFVEEGEQGPDIAQRYLDLHAGEFTPDDANSVSDHIRTQRNALAAEQRRQEAESRRELHQQQADAGNRAEDGIRLLEDGVPIPAKQQAQLLSDARLSGRPGLEARVKTGLLKGNLTLQYQNHTPGELQDQINELGTKIRAAGDHAKPEDVIAFHHLETLRDKSASDLRQDALSWGAAHLGVHVPALNTSDPASIAARNQAAAKIEARTGVPVSPLTADEAGLEAAHLSGTIQDRSGVVSRLALFGPRAMQVAQQVAPNDAAFQSLVGLATASNPVARRYVGQVFAGTEVLKRNPKAVDTTQAQVRFNNYVGGALSLMPTVSSGVFTNAKNIAAAWADQHGHTDWKMDPAISDQFEGSIDAALGAYHQNGVKYGGLGLWRGQRIVLPDGMSQPDFDMRLSRATKEGILRGSNGVPVWSNGHPLQVREVVNSRMVAVGDGIYRLTDGNGFVQRQGGGFYEINVRRVGSPIGR